MATRIERASLTPRLISLAVASCFSGAAYAQVLPTGPHAMSGIAGINTVNSTMTVTTSANRSIVNWQTFSIGSGATVDIQQLGASSAILNRVTGANGRIDPSSILGTLQSNGRVFLLNPSGIVFGAGSRIDVAGLIASSLNLSDTDFLGGRLRFTEVPGAGSVVNQGAINAATGGQVYLVGPSVTNSGIITSPKGEVILAAGNSVELVNPGTPNLRVEITASGNEAKNLKDIVAEAGRVGIYAGLITHSGTTRADSAVATADGRIVLKATKNTTVEAGSVISANGPSGGQVTIQSGDTTVVSGTVSATGSAGTGGAVQVLGNLVGLDGNASIDVSGETGGGTALVGGAFQGKDPNVQNASRTYFGPNAKIRADAIGNGDGGTVVVWSDDVTGAYGTISARGGRDSGNGGLVEVSSKGWLDFRARVDTSAPKGRTGTLLLDPVNVCIEDSSGACGSGGVGSFMSGGMASVFTSSGGMLSVLQWSASGGAGSIYDVMRDNNVVITTSGPGPADGNITVADSSPDLATDNHLVFVAHRDVFINRRIWNTGQGELRVHAGWDEGATSTTALGADPLGPVVLIPGVGNITVDDTVDMHGNIFMRAGNNIDVNALIQGGSSSSPGNRSLTLDAGNRLQIFSDVMVNAGPAMEAKLDLLAGMGGIVINGGEGITLRAAGAPGSSGAGGSAVATMTTPGSVSITNATIDVSGGEGRSGSPTGAGGNASFTLSSGGPATLSSSTIRVTAGRGGDGAEGITGGMGGTASMMVTASSLSLTGESALRVIGGDGGEGGPGFSGAGGVAGGRGGDATFTLNTTGPVMLAGASTIEVSGGRGGDGGFATDGGDGGAGGRGGDAIFTSTIGSLSLTETSTIQVAGGRGGNGGSLFASSDSGGFTATAGPGGNGGNATFTMNTGPVSLTGASTIEVAGGRGGNGGSFDLSSCDCSEPEFGFTFLGGRGGDGGNGVFTMNAGAVTLTGGSTIEVDGGKGGYGGDGLSFGRSGDGGNGGMADMTMNMALLSLTGSEIRVRGGEGGEGGYGDNGADGGNGGNGGSASLIINSTVPGNFITLNGSTIAVDGGRGGRGGDSGSDTSGSGGPILFGLGGAGGNGGSASGSLTATNISLTGSEFTVRGGGPGGGGSGSAALAATGQGGNATAIVNSGGNVNFQASTVSAERGLGAEGQVNGGNVMVKVAADGSLVVGSASMISALAGDTEVGNGGTAQTSLLADSVVVDGGSGIFATGGAGSAAGGVATLTIGATGPISISSSNLTTGGGIFALAGAGDTGGSATALISSTFAGVTLTDSIFGSAGGAGVTAGGTAVTQINAFGGNIVIQGSPGTFNSAVIAVGGLASGAGGVGGDSELNLVASGTTTISNSVAAAFGGLAFEGSGGDATFNAVSPGGFSVLLSEAGAFGGFGGLAGGNATVNVVSGNIRVEGGATGGGTLEDFLASFAGLLLPPVEEPPLEEPPPDGTLIASGGATPVGGIPGAAKAALAVLGPDGTIAIVDDRIEVRGGMIFDPADPFTPLGFGLATIEPEFVGRLSGGFSVNGQDGVISVGTSGFFVNGNPAQPGVNFLLVYRGIAPPLATPTSTTAEPPITFDSQQIASLIALAELLSPRQDEADTTGPGKDEKKKQQAECR